MTKPDANEQIVIDGHAHFFAQICATPRGKDAAVTLARGMAMSAARQLGEMIGPHKAAELFYQLADDLAGQ